MQATITFTGGLVRKGKLNTITTSNGEMEVINFTVARNYTKKEGNDYVDNGTYYVNCTLWGKKAVLFDQSDIPTGFRLIIAGTLNSRLQAEYTNKDGHVVPEHYEEVLNVSDVGVALDYKQIVKASRTSDNNSSASSAPVQNTATTSNVTASAPVQNTAATNMFDDNSSTTSSSSDDEFEDLFGDL